MDKSEIEAVIEKAQTCRIAMVDGGQPYVVPVCFGYREGAVFFHTKVGGRKMEALRRDGRVCVEFEADVEMRSGEMACKFSFRYRSVIAFGRAVELHEPSEKVDALNVIMRHYTGRDWEFPAEKVARVGIVRIDIESMTGKSAGL
jgi:nitroimidazol reductase NimA-like FMN-containing flavoprotein (pyridoxamine 5'-phosphate oxidase superfamily)